jgi:hypothetical protein
LGTDVRQNGLKRPNTPKGSHGIFPATTPFLA